MNDTQKQRITEFLNGIIDSSLPAEQQIKVFAQDDNVEGGDQPQKNGACVNKTVACKGSQNASCSNYESCCDGASNQLLCDQGLTDIDFDTHSCGN